MADVEDVAVRSCVHSCQVGGRAEERERVIVTTGMLTVMCRAKF